MRILLLAALCVVSCCAQAVRFDPLPSTTISSAGSQPYGYPQVLAIPFSVVTVCGYPANAFPCTNFATTYTDQTASTQCAAGSPVVLAGSATCTNVSDRQGNFGFWLIPGNYVYELTIKGVTYGPYPLTAGSTIFSINAGSGIVVNGSQVSTIYNGLDAYSPIFCATPLAPTDACIMAAFNAGISNTVIASSGATINGTIDVPDNQNLTLRAGAYTLGNNGKLILEAGASLTCPDGPDSTYFLVPATYAVTDQVWSLAGGNSANQTITGCGIRFFVPSGSTTRAGMVHYAAAALGSVAGTQATGVLVQHVKITGAWDCFRMNTGAGNGKVTFRDANVSSFNTLADIDNIFDTITFDNVHWWPWGLTGPQFPAFFDPANVGIRSGRCDDLQVSNSLFDGGQAMSFYTGTGGVTTFTLTSVKFDTNAGITMTAGQGTMNGGYFSIGNTAARAFNMSGGIFASSGVQWGIVSTTTNSQIQISGPSQFYASSSYFNTGPNDVTMVGISGSAAYVSLIGNQFLRTANVVFVNPTILDQDAARVMLNSNILTDKGTGLGYFLTMPNDSQSVIADNSLLGWSMALPASFSSINYHDNSNVGPSSTGQQHLSVFPVSCTAGQHVASINTNGVATCN